MVSVSYTHLDVYKRQHNICAVVVGLSQGHDWSACLPLSLGQIIQRSCLAYLGWTKAHLHYTQTETTPTPPWASPHPWLIDDWFLSGGCGTWVVWRSAAKQAAVLMWWWWWSTVVARSSVTGYRELALWNSRSINKACHPLISYGLDNMLMLISYSSSSPLRYLPSSYMSIWVTARTGPTQAANFCWRLSIPRNNAIHSWGQKIRRLQIRLQCYHFFSVSVNSLLKCGKDSAFE